MEMLLFDLQLPNGNEAGESPCILSNEEECGSDPQTSKVKEMEESSVAAHSEESDGDRESLKGNDAQEAPSTIHFEEGEDDGVPCVGMKFYSEDRAYAFYNEYAARIGFSIRKGVKYYNARGALRQRSFVCSKAGLKLDHVTVRVKKANKLETRTNCKAKLRFTLTDGVWEITYFNPQHNHELAEPEQRKLLRSNRKMLEANFLTSMVNTLDCQEVGCDVVPSIGMKVYSEDEAYNMYNGYATQVGFSIRRGITRYSSKGVLRQRNYVCSKQGAKLDDDACGVKKGSNLEKRTDCKASIRFTVMDSEWEVTNFNPNHNHELVRADQRKFLRSKGKMSKVTAGSMTPISNGFITPVNSCSVLTGQDSNADIFGLTPREKLNKIDAGDSQGLINYLKHKKSKDLMFFYSVQVDKSNHMTNFFWRDGRSRLDYDYFGDVVVFDTTFRSDKYNLVCAPFMGVNHHGKDVLFGCALLLDETVPSFIWLFESFLISMGNQQPKTIFTDHCTAMATAIEKVFPMTCHRRCLWQIGKNVKQHLCDLSANLDFMTLLNKCLDGCCTELDFQAAWDEMIERYKLAGNNWLMDLYDLRQKWCPTFSLDTFSAGMRPTQRSESANKVFHHTLCDKMNLTQLLSQYEQASEQMRLAELEEDLHCNQESLTRASRSSGMLKHAADIYTIEIFKLFQEEMIESLSIVMNELSNAWTLQTYELTEEGQESGQIVYYDSASCTALCSCKMFESVGVLCRHALRVLNMKNVTKIPSHYILKRWTKGARKGMVTPEIAESLCNNNSPSLLRSRLMYKAFCAINKSLMTMKGTEIADGLLDQIIKQAESYTTTLNVSGDIPEGDKESVQGDSFNDTNEKHTSLNELPVLDPPSVAQNGVGNDRTKSQKEKKGKRKASKDNTSSGRAKQQTVIRPSGTFYPPQVTTFFLPQYHPPEVGMEANSYVFPTFLQNHFPTWTIPTSCPTIMPQGTYQRPHSSQVMGPLEYRMTYNAVFVLYCVPENFNMAASSAMHLSVVLNLSFRHGSCKYPVVLMLTYAMSSYSFDFHIPGRSAMQQI